LTLCGITDIRDAVYAKYTADAQRFGCNDPRVLESAILVAATATTLAAATTVDVEGLNPLRDVLRGRLELPSQSTAWQATHVLLSFLERQLVQALLLADSEWNAGDVDMEQVTEAASALVGEWMSLVPLDLELRVGQGIDPRQASGLVARAFAFLIEQGLSDLAADMRDNLRRRIETWHGDGGLLKLIDTFTSVSSGDPAT
jgi:hypothetical protein